MKLKKILEAKGIKGWSPPARHAGKWEEKEPGLRAVRALNSLSNDISKLKYPRQVEWGKKNPKDIEKVIKHVDALYELIKKMK